MLTWISNTITFDMSQHRDVDRPKLSAQHGTQVTLPSSYPLLFPQSRFSRDGSSECSLALRGRLDSIPDHVSWLGWESSYQGPWKSMDIIWMWHKLHWCNRIPSRHQNLNDKCATCTISKTQDRKSWWNKSSVTVKSKEQTIKHANSLSQSRGLNNY